MLNKKLLLTCGIGDFFVLDYFYNFEHYNDIIIASPQSEIISHLIYNFWGKQKTITQFNTIKEINQICFLFLNDILIHPNVDVKFKNIVCDADDFGIMTKFNDIRNNLTNKKLNSSVLSVNLNIKEKLNLIEPFYIISFASGNEIFHCLICDHPHSNICPRTQNKRSFVPHDWFKVIEFLTLTNNKAVVLGDIELPNELKKNEYLIDLTNQLNIIESIDLMKSAIGYIGIDSCFSVLASYLYEPKNIYIKCTNKHGYEWKDIYWYNTNITPMLNMSF